MPAVAPTPHEAIRNTIALYCIALDTKQWNILSQEVFTQNVEAVYPFDGKAIHGVEALAKRIEERYVCGPCGACAVLSVIPPRKATLCRGIKGGAV